jgi:hypothetical protein
MKLALLCALLGATPAISAETTAIAPRDSLAVSDGALRLTVDGALRFEEGPRGRVWLLDAWASQPLAEVVPFIHEDGFADVRRDSGDPRRFTVVVREEHELSTLLVGQRLFVHLKAEDGSQKNAMIQLAAGFDQFEGHRSIYVEQGIRPVYVEDGVTNLRFRGTVQSALAVVGTNDDDTEPAMTAHPAGLWTADWEPGAFFVAADHADPVVWRTSAAQKRTHITFFVAALGLTERAAEVAWPQADETCADDVRACVVTTDVDKGACGPYRAVARCVRALAEEDPYPPCSVDSDCLRAGQVCGVDGLCFFIAP